MVDKGDTAWMFMATVLVMLMIVPGLALFYGGLVRAKNILSVLMQVLVVASLALVLWVAYGYSLAFTLLAAVLLAFTRVWGTRVPQEALIGVIYVVAAAAASPVGRTSAIILPT